MTSSHGTVSKRTWIYQGAKRSAFAYAFTYKDHAGQPQRARGQADTREGAHAAMNARKAELAAPVVVEVKAAVSTLADYAEQWMTRVSRDVAQRTVRNYRWSYRTHILPALGTRPLDAITRGDVVRLLNDKRVTLGKNTVRLIRAALSALLAAAVDEELIPVNHALKVGKGRKTSDSISAAERREKVKALDRDQLARFLTVAQADRLHPLWLFMADTGCRPGEAFALQWENVDLVGKTATIKAAIDLDGSTKSTKTGGIRRVDLSSRLVAALDAHQTVQEVSALTSGRGAPGLVFPSTFNTPLDGNNAANYFRRILARAGLPKLGGPYLLRHTWASHALAAGEAITVVSHNLGHATPAITLSTYSHFLPSDSHGAADRLEQWRTRLQESPVPSDLLRK